MNAPVKRQAEASALAQDTDTPALQVRQDARDYWFPSTETAKLRARIDALEFADMMREQEHAMMVEALHAALCNVRDMRARLDRLEARSQGDGGGERESEATT